MHNAADRRPQNGAAHHPDGPDVSGADDLASDDLAGGGHGGLAAGGLAAGALPGAIEAAGAMIRLAEGIAAAGRPIDLEGLDDTVGRICAQALDLPPEAGVRLRPGLAGLVAALDRLSVALRRP